MYEFEVSQKYPILLAISTCPRCDRMKKFLKMHNVDAKIVDIDLLDKKDKAAHLRFVQPMNPSLSFPTLIVGDIAVIGEDYAEVKEVLGL